jgi:hypothetical protein
MLFLELLVSVLHVKVSPSLPLMVNLENGTKCTRNELPEQVLESLLIHTQDPSHQFQLPEASG